MNTSIQQCLPIVLRLEYFNIWIQSLPFILMNKAFIMYYIIQGPIITYYRVIRPRAPSTTSYFWKWGSCTRGSKFWSSKVCEGGESREAYACRLNFDPPQFLFEINDHVTKTHFWSAFKLIENLILIRFEQIKVDQN